MTSSKRLMALAVLPAVLLAGCGGGDSKKSSSSTTSGSASSASSSSSLSTLAKPVTNGNLADVKVDTSKKDAPVVTIPKDKLPFGTKDSTSRVVTPGQGATVGATDLVDVNAMLVNGTTGKTLTSSFGQQTTALDLASSVNLPAIAKAIKGQKVGANILVSIPAKEAFSSGAPDPASGLTKNDDVLFYINIASTHAMLSEATGTASPSPSGLPTVTVPTGHGKEAKITIPKGAKAPTSLKTAVLVQGTGATVKSGQTIATNYTGQIWNGAVFDSTAKHGGNASSFVIGKNQVIKAWDKALVGQKVGSRVLIVVPPADGYGTTGNPQAGIKGTDTLVFVVDILAAY